MKKKESTEKWNRKKSRARVPLKKIMRAKLKQRATTPSYVERCTSQRAEKGEAWTRKVYIKKGALAEVSLTKRGMKKDKGRGERKWGREKKGI